MNKQELIEKYKNKYPVISMDIKEFRYFIELWGDVKQLDEPQKPVVPQFVADWIEKVKGKGEPLYYALDRTPPEEVEFWFCEDEVKRQEIFARAWLDGYTVEKDKRYLVKMKSVEDILGFLNFGGITKTWFMGDEINSYGCRTHHTRDELEQAGFGWVFSCEGIEIEEVEG